MVRPFTIFAAIAAIVALSPMAPAQQAGQGTAAEAKAMLVRAIAAVKADKTKALDMFAKGQGGFLDRDLYPFCFNSTDGKVHPFANPNGKALFGRDQRTIKDAAGDQNRHVLFDEFHEPTGDVWGVDVVARVVDHRPVVTVGLVTLSFESPRG